MPLYAVRCPGCGAQDDIFRSLERYDDLPACEFCGERVERLICAPFVQGDLPEYQAVAVDRKTGRTPRIEGRAQHREFLKRNGYIEVGNEKPKNCPYQGDHNVRRELTEATREVLAKQRR